MAPQLYPLFTEKHLKHLNQNLAKLPPQKILEWAIVTLPGLYQTTAFGLTEFSEENETEPQHLVPLIFLDTLYHFSETLQLANNVSTRYKVPLHVFKPIDCETVESFEAQHGQNLWENDEDSYDFLVKVEPSRRAYKQLNVLAVITGRRRSQKGERESIDILELEKGTGLIKLNPLAHWDFAKVKAYIKANEVPYNPLLDQGYRSIGDWHSTKPLNNDSSNERDGRWEGKNKTECVRFITKQPEFAVTDTPILVPAKLKRYGLSEIINHLLGFEKPVPFDFMIDNLFLRTSLLEYLENSGLSTENIITVEYVESILPPTPLSSFQHDDWISSVKSYNQRYFLTGSYDNYARIWNASGECLQTFVGHNAPIKSVSWVSVQASQDRTIRAWKSSFEHNKYISLYECVGHKDSVESVSVSPSGSEFASGSWDSSIMLWTMEIPEDSDDDEHIKIHTSSKRRKVNKKEKIRTKYPIATMNGHVGAVSSVTFDHDDNNKLYSGGWDHTIRIWDVEARTNIDTKNCDKVVYGISYSNKSGLIASGHSDRVIRIWDPRATDTAIVKLTLLSHKNWVTSISWSTTNSFMLASGSYDGTVKIWDVRSKTPLYTLSKQQNDDKGKEKENIKIKKVFSVDWDNDVILSGGEDNQLHVYGTKKIGITDEKLGNKKR
ncbi:16987_t:CDS:10 [Funneliformis geosporum]|uniref:Ribosome biogenesis protein YTM1 n=1 Tax=Funneliformis geosporum TaxID=1117311 RepID=A0A9W4STL1_9GLOM|nr:16987_t:CDS:10 [Funneliformis geosporum]CAI2180867.1 8204_t:CDS:10 [Funneliformis geosporum]